MPHCDPDTLALAALGEPLAAQDAGHLATCTECQHERDELAVVVGVARGGSVLLESPPDTVWQGVRHHLDQDPVPSLDPRRRRRWPALVGAAAVLVALVGGFAIGRETLSPAGGVTLSSATLSPLPGSPNGASGRAVLHQQGGAYTLDVDTNGVGAPQGFYEVWLMRPDDSGLVSLGTMSATQGHGTFSVPAGLPLDSFTAVDISDEPLDGNPGHSAVSVLRGVLTA